MLRMTVKNAFEIGIRQFSRCDVLRKNLKNPAIAYSQNGSSILCWHPEPKFPYEHTKPLPRKESEISEGDSALKLQHIEDFESRRRPDGPTRGELKELFFTNKHRWYPKPRQRYANAQFGPVGKDRKSV